MNTSFTCNSTALGVSMDASDGSDATCTSETEPQISLRFNTALKTASGTISTPTAVQAMPSLTAPVIVSSSTVSTSIFVAAEIPASSSLTPASPESKTFSTPLSPSPPATTVAVTAAASAALDSSVEFLSTIILSRSAVVVTETFPGQETTASTSRGSPPVKSVSAISSKDFSSTPASSSSSRTPITSSLPSTMIGSSPTLHAHLTVIVTSTVLSILLISGAALLIRRRMKWRPSNAKNTKQSGQIDPFVLPIRSIRRNRRSILKGKAQILPDRPIQHIPTMQANEPLRTEVAHLPRPQQVNNCVAGPAASYPASPLALRNPGSLSTPGTSPNTHAVVGESNDRACSSRQQLSANCDVTTVPRVVSGTEILPTMMQGFHDLQTRITRITNFLREQHQDADQDMISQLASSEQHHSQISPPAYDGEIETG